MLVYPPKYRKGHGNSEMKLFDRCEADQAGRFRQKFNAMLIRKHPVQDMFHLEDTHGTFQVGYLAWTPMFDARKEEVAGIVLRWPKMI